MGRRLLLPILKASIITGVIASMFPTKKWNSTLSILSPSTKNKARSIYGRVAKAADRYSRNLMHTERDPSL